MATSPNVELQSSGLYTLHMKQMNGTSLKLQLLDLTKLRSSEISWNVMACINLYSIEKNLFQILQFVKKLTKTCLELFRSEISKGSRMLGEHIFNFAC